MESSATASHDGQKTLHCQGALTRVRMLKIDSMTFAKCTVDLPEARFPARKPSSVLALCGNPSKIEIIRLEIASRLGNRF